MKISHRLIPLLAAAVIGLPAAEEAPAYLRYAHPTVTAPFRDGINLTVPPELTGSSIAAWGFVDVTRPPFRADPTGQADSTKALQAAINFARDHQMVCYFPAGTYRISDTLSCIQQLYQRSNGRVFGAPLWPCVLMGSRAGVARPKILLSPRSPGFDNPDKPKRVVHFWARGYANPTTADRVSDGLSPEVEQPNISMNQVLVNLDITIGEGNPGAVALRHQAAEGSAIEDCTIDATHGLVGIEGGIGSGGGCAGVTVIGGRIGLDFTGYLSGTQPTPVITGFTLLGQTGMAIRSTSRQTLVAAGLKIVADKTTGPLIQCLPPAGQPANGQLTLVDSEIVFPQPRAAGGPERVGIASSRSVYLENVYVRGADQVLRAEGVQFQGNPNGWLRIRQSAHGPAAPGRAGDAPYRHPVYLNGTRQNGALMDAVKDTAPPADLQSRHLWPRDFPGWETAGAANVKQPPFNAKGDGVSDDTAALQAAIAAQEVVFLPKGYYRITRTLDLKPNTRLIGAAQHLSVLVAVRAEGDFADAAKPAPLVRTADAADANTALAFIGLWAPSDLPGIYALHWRSGGRSVFRGAELFHGSAPSMTGRRGPAPPRRHPAVLVAGHGGGNWYNLRDGGEYAQAPGYRHLLVEGAAGPLNFYQLSPQHVSSDYAVEIRKSANIAIFGTKYEGSSPMLRAAESSGLRLYGHGGNGKPVADSALFYLDSCRDFLLANLVDGPTKIGSVSLSHRKGATDPKLWSMLVEHPPGGQALKTVPLDRPVLYQQGRGLRE